jgi:hypothetical protein
MNEQPPLQPLPCSPEAGPDPKEMQAREGERKADWQGYDPTLLTALFED